VFFALMVNGALTVNKDCVRVRKSIVVDGVSEPMIKFAIESNREYPVAIQVYDMVPEEFSKSEVDFQDEGDYWRISESQVEFSRIIAPGDSLVTAYSVDYSEEDVQQFSDPPVINAVSPIDPEDIEKGNEAPLWRGQSTGATTRAGDQEVTEADGGQLVAQDDTTSLLLSRDSKATPALSVVMPTLNEEQGIAECIERIKRAVETLGVSAEVIVSDSSTDRTPEIARELGAIVVEPDKKGYGYAYRYAFEYARGEYIAIGDADTTYDFLDLPQLLNPVGFGSADMVMGDRLNGEIMPGAMPRLHQYVGNPLLTKFLNVFYDAGVSDSHSGFRVISRDTLDRLNLTSDGMEFASEMVMKAGAEGLRIEEVPITYHERQGEATLSSFRDGWRHVKFMIMNAPSYLFSVPAVGFGLLGAVVMLLSLLEMTLGGIFFGLHTVVAGSLLVISSYQIGGLALISAIATDPIKEQRDPVTNWIQRNLFLEHALTFGLLLLTVGSGYVVYLVIDWIMSGYVTPSFNPMHMLAFTAVVLGVQTVFTAFLSSMLLQERDVSSEIDVRHKSQPE
jgi:glycosyltransferase involved in cell wall biosynthesis